MISFFPNGDLSYNAIGGGGGVSIDNRNEKKYKANITIEINCNEQTCGLCRFSGYDKCKLTEEKLKTNPLDNFDNFRSEKCLDTFKDIINVSGADDKFHKLEPSNEVPDPNRNNFW